MSVLPRGPVVGVASSDKSHHVTQAAPAQDTVAQAGPTKGPSACYVCTDPGHWVKDYPNKGQFGSLVPRVGKEFWRQAKGMEWDTSQEPPTACLKCGVKHLSNKPTATCVGPEIAVGARGQSLRRWNGSTQHHGMG